MSDQEIPPQPLELLANNDAWVRRLAGRLTRDSNTAQDVVQEAYLAALSPASRPFGPLRVWLTGVVRHIASDYMRRENALRERQRRAAKSETAGSTLEQLERLEKQKLLIAALLKVPDPFREVLLLRYIEECSHSAIASQLGIPKSTVKSRLERGRARLRTSLDSQCNGDRTHWLTALAPIVDFATKPSHLTCGHLFMKIKLTASFAALALTLVVGAIAINKLDPEKPSPEMIQTSSAFDTKEGRRKTPNTKVTLPPSMSKDSQGPTQMGTRSPHPGATGPAAFGRFVDTNGTPIGGVLILPRKGAQRIKTTASDGKFRISLASYPTNRTIKLRVWHERFATKSVELKPQTLGDSIDFGDVVLQAGVQVTVLLVDQYGQSLPGFRLALRQKKVTALDQQGFKSIPYVSAMSDANGQVIFQERLAESTWEVHCNQLGVQSLTPHEISISKGNARPFTVVVEVFDSITGQVLLSDGNRFLDRFSAEAASKSSTAGIAMRVGSTARSTGATRVSAVGVISGKAAAGSRVQPDGTFKLTAMRGAESEVNISLESGGDYSSTTIRATWGEQGVKLVIEPTPSIRLLVVDQSTGQPITDFGLSIEANPSGYKYLNVRQIEPGQIRVGGLQAGTNWLFVVPHDGHAVKGPIQVETSENVFTVAVRKEETLDVDLVDAAGKPVPGAHVQLIGMRVGQQLEANNRITSGRSPNLFPGEGAAVAWDGSKSDALGSVRLAWPDLIGWQFYVKASSPDLGHQFAPIAAFTQSTTIAFPKVGQLRCQLVGDWNPQTRVWIEPISQDPKDRLGGPWGYLMREELEHQFPGVPLGDWRVIVSIGSIEAASPFTPVVQGTLSTIKLEASDYLVPAQELLVTQTGVPVSEGTLRLHWPDFVFSGQPREHHLDLQVSDGFCTLPALIPGSYRFSFGGLEINTHVSIQTPELSSLEF